MSAKYARPADMPNTFFEKHLIISRSDGQSLKIPPTRREACLRSVLGTGAQVEAKSIQNGLLVTVHTYAHSQQLQKLAKLSTGTTEVPVKCVPHNSLNYTKGVLHDRFGELADEQPDHLSEALAREGVVDINRIMVTPSQGGQRIPGKTYFLTFLRDDLPKKVKVGYEVFPIQEYTPRPQFCANCLRYGHVAKFCRSKAKCKKCGSDEHASNACTSESTKCYNCTLNHPTGSKECSTYIREQEVLKVMNRDHLLPRDARAKVDHLEDHGGLRTSTVVANATASELQVLKLRHGQQTREINGLKATVQRLTDDRAKLLAGGSLVAELTERISTMEEQCKQLPLLHKELDNQRELFKKTEVHHQKVQQELERKLDCAHKELEATKLQVSASTSSFSASHLNAEQVKQLQRELAEASVELAFSRNELARLRKPKGSKPQPKPPTEESSLDDSKSSMPPPGTVTTALSGLAKASGQKRNNEDLSSSPPREEGGMAVTAIASPAKKKDNKKSPHQNRNSKYSNPFYPERGHSGPSRGQRGSDPRGRGRGRGGHSPSPSPPARTLPDYNRFSGSSETVYADI